MLLGRRGADEGAGGRGGKTPTAGNVVAPAANVGRDGARLSRKLSWNSFAVDPERTVFGIISGTKERRVRERIREKAMRWGSQGQIPRDNNNEVTA